MTFNVGRQSPIPLPTQYSAEIVRSDGDRAKIFVDSDRKRIEQFINGLISIVIYRPDLDVMYTDQMNGKWISIPLDKQMLEMTRDTGNEDVEWEYVGDEGGLSKFHVYSVGTSVLREILYIDNASKLRMKSVTIDRLGKPGLVTELRNVSLGPPSGDVFNLPSNTPV